MQTIKHFINTHKHMWWGLYLPVYLIMFFTIEHFITDNYWATQTVIDDYIPFVEYFAIPYDSWGPMLFVLGVFLILKAPDSFRRYMWFIAIAFTTATIFCALVPNGQDLRPEAMPRQNLSSWILQMTYDADTNTNVFPSVHVLGVVAAISAMWHTPKLKRVWQIVGTVWFVIIAASTLLVKQHAFIDLAAALVWGAVVYVIVYVIIGHKRDKMGLRCGAETVEKEAGHDHSPDPGI